jgi:hypothetical protein
MFDSYVCVCKSADVKKMNGMHIPHTHYVVYLDNNAFCCASDTLAFGCVHLLGCSFAATMITYRSWMETFLCYVPTLVR